MPWIEAALLCYKPSCLSCANHNKTLLLECRSVIKVPSVITFFIKVPFVITFWDMSTTVHGYFNFQGRRHHGSCDESEQGNNRRKKIPQNPAIALGSSLGKFIHVTVSEISFKKKSSLQNKINIVMSKMLSLTVFNPVESFINFSPTSIQYFTYSWILLIGFHGCQYFDWNGVSFLWISYILVKCNKAYAVAKYKLTGFKNWEFPEINDCMNE